MFLSIIRINHGHLLSVSVFLCWIFSVDEFLNMLFEICTNNITSATKYYIQHIFVFFSFSNEHLTWTENSLTKAVQELISLRSIYSEKPIKLLKKDKLAMSWLLLFYHIVSFVNQRYRNSHHLDFISFRNHIPTLRVLLQSHHLVISKRSIRVQYSIILFIHLHFRSSLNLCFRQHKMLFKHLLFIDQLHRSANNNIHLSDAWIRIRN